ncbi:FAD-dependent oxidase [Bacillus thuringiensis serovar kurstaki str. HD-1]|nr:FAD-dependent oxidase [Bacillus thuringiensis serovar kurstaki str. HD-1]
MNNILFACIMLCVMGIICKCQDKHVHFRLFKHVQNQSFSLLK